MKKICLAAMTLLTPVCLVVSSLQPAHAEDEPTYTWEWGVTCSSFAGDQAAAQEYYVANGQPADLDLNGNGMACDSPEDGDFTPHATAGPDPTCGTWGGDQAEAQEYYDNHGQPAELDLNGNGVACDSPEDGDFSPWPPAEPVQNGPSAWPDVTCADFPGGPEAGAAYFATYGGPASLDPDGDGVACEAEEILGSGPSAWPEWTCETFPDGVDAAIAYFETYGGPSTLDPDGNGVACDEGGNEATSTEVGSDDVASEAADGSTDAAQPVAEAVPAGTTVTTLPVAGSGHARPAMATAMVALASAATILTLAGLVSRYGGARTGR